MTERSLTILAASPHTAPVNGDVLCSFDSDLGRTTAIWDNADPSAFIDVYLLVDGALNFVGTLAGGASSATVEGTTSPEQVIVLQFFAAFDGDCRKDDDWCLYRTGKGPYPGLFALGKKRKIKGWD